MFCLRRASGLVHQVVTIKVLVEGDRSCLVRYLAHTSQRISKKIPCACMVCEILLNPLTNADERFLDYILCDGFIMRNQERRPRCLDLIALHENLQSTKITAIKVANSLRVIHELLSYSVEYSYQIYTMISEKVGVYFPQLAEALSVHKYFEPGIRFKPVWNGGVRNFCIPDLD